MTSVRVQTERGGPRRVGFYVVDWFCIFGLRAREKNNMRYNFACRPSSGAGHSPLVRFSFTGRNTRKSSHAGLLACWPADLLTC